MPINPEELTDVRIERTVHCDKCGYNLYTLRAAGRCPECGNRYNTMGRCQQGIFKPHENVFPWSDIATAIITGSVGVGFTAVFVSMRPLRAIYGLCAAVFLAIAVVCAMLAWRQVSRYLRFRKVEREDDELGL